MASKASIISAINSKVGNSHRDYQIGITDNTRERKEYWTGQGKITRFWSEWEAESSTDAKDIEAHFIHEKGMRGGTGGTITSKTKWVYVF